MPKEFKLPDLGEGVAEGEIVKWLVSEGDSIKEDQPMVEVMTDKATVQIPSPVTGKVRQILVKEGQTVKVGTSVVLLDTKGEVQAEKPSEEVEKPLPQQKAIEVPEQKAPAATSAGGPSRVIATPATRKLARELNVDLGSITGSGPGGRITEEDVKKVAKGLQQVQVQQIRAAPAEAREPQKAEARTVSPQPVVALEREERIVLHGIRKRIAEKMVKSVHTAAQVTHVDEADFTQLVSLRENLKSIAEKHGVKLTYLPFLMKAVVQALKEFPYFNASIDDEKQEIIVKHYYNISFAADTPNGLIAPNVKDVDKKGIVQLAKEIEDIATRAREGKVTLEEIQGGTFTITNIGTLGGVISTPIINVPEVAILGVHKIQKKPVVRDNQIVIRDMVNLALTFDHRIVDGADAARLMSKLIKILENPALLLLDTGIFE